MSRPAPRAAARRRAVPRLVELLGAARRAPAPPPPRRPARPARRRDRPGRLRRAVRAHAAGLRASSPCVLVLALVQAARRRRCRSRVCFAAMAAVRAAGPRAYAGPVAAGPACATCGPTSSTTSPPACAPGWRCPRRSPSSATAGRRSCARRSRAFADDYRPTGRFHDCLDRLKDRLADPVGDRLVETLRIAREVGGTDLGRLLRTLSAFLREDARTRAELETRQAGRSTPPGSPSPRRGSCSAMLSTNPESVRGLLDAPLGVARPGRRRRGDRRRLLGDGPDRPAARGRAGAAMSALARSGAVLGFVLGPRAGAGLARPAAGTVAPGLAGSGAALPARHPAPVPAARRRAPAGAGAARGSSRPGPARPRPGRRAGHGRRRLACAAASCAPGWPPTSTGSAPSRCSGAAWVRSSAALLGVLALVAAGRRGRHRSCCSPSSGSVWA